MKIAAENNLFFIKHYIRIPNPTLTSAQRNIITLDRADRKALDAIQDIALSQSHEWKNKKEIKHFFSEKILGWNFLNNKTKFMEVKNGKL